MKISSVVADSTGFVGTPTPHLPVLRTLYEIRQVARRLESQGRNCFVRYSLGPEADALVGPSANQYTGAGEVGLAFNHVPAADVAGGIRDYAYLLWQKSATVPWLATGTKCGNGSDGEPLLKEVEAIAWIHLRAVVEAICRADDDALLMRIGYLQAQRRGLPPGYRAELRPAVKPTIP